MYICIHIHVYIYIYIYSVCVHLPVSHFWTTLTLIKNQFNTCTHIYIFVNMYICIACLAFFDVAVGLCDLFVCMHIQYENVFMFVCLHTQ